MSRFGELFSVGKVTCHTPWLRLELKPGGFGRAWLTQACPAGEEAPGRYRNSGQHTTWDVIAQVVQIVVEGGPQTASQDTKEHQVFLGAQEHFALTL